MSAVHRPKRLACIHCASTKRKCSKQTPSCRRCVDKGFVCQYPTARVAPPYHLVYSEDGQCSAISNNDERFIAEENLADNSHTTKNTRQDSSSITSLAQSEQLRQPWFLSLSSWQIDHKDVLDSRIYFGDGALNYYIDKVRGWLQQWSSSGQAPFTHANLYKIVLPEPIQDAFTALAAYHSRTKATERMVFRIIEQYTERLLQQQLLHSPDVVVIMLDTIAHLARTQALLTYSIICLFDGDIRARSYAETKLDTLIEWAKQLWQTVELDITSNKNTAWSVVDDDNQSLSVPALKSDGTIPSAWRAWIFAESIRRTYITTELVVAAYLTLKQGWAPCRGGITFTPEAAPWAATSPYSWWRHMSNSSLGPLKCVNAHEIFNTDYYLKIDEFTHAVLVVSYGLEYVNQWQDRIDEDSIAPRSSIN